MKSMLKAAMILFSCLVVVTVLWFIPEMNVEQLTAVNKQEQAQEKTKKDATTLDKARLEQIKEEIESAQRRGGQLLNSFTSSYSDPNQTIEENRVPEYEYVDGIIYYVLKKEYAVLDYSETPDVSLLVREYMMIDDVTKNKAPYTEKTAIPKQESLKDVKHYLRIYEPDSLELPPNTIVTEQVIDQWMSEAYNPLQEYTEESPRRLTVEKLKRQAQAQPEENKKR